MPDYINISQMTLGRYINRNPRQLKPHEKEGNTLNQQRLEVAKVNKVDFYFSFHNQDYISKNYGEWSDYGYDIISIPFSGNPLTYFFQELSVNKYDYTFLGSTNPEKAGRYYKYFSRYR